MSNENTCLTLRVKLDRGMPWQITFHMYFRRHNDNVFQSRDRDTENNSGDDACLVNN